jgi:hypothetical protein
MNWKGFGRYPSLPSPGIYLEGVRKTTQTSVRIALSGGDSDRVSLEYKSTASTARLCSLSGSEVKVKLSLCLTN